MTDGAHRPVDSVEDPSRLGPRSVIGVWRFGEELQQRRPEVWQYLGTGRAKANGIVDGPCGLLVVTARGEDLDER